MTLLHRSASIALAAGIACAYASCGSAMPATYRFDLASQPLTAALKAIGRAAGLEVIIEASAVDGLTAPALHGNMTVQEALDRVAAGHALRIQLRDDAILVGSPSSDGHVDNSPESDPQSQIVVTGSRIRGEHPASPVIAISREQMEYAGQNSLGDVVRDIPQNFAGGQNPNVLQSSGGAGNDNLNSASTINLRGLGPSATLTLVNGHRLSYDGASQAVDVSAIPVAAIERLEIVADGASALYGSDAVGGVANIILRRDFEGLQTDARLGGATQGGDFQQQYDLVTGSKWNSGGLIATYNFERDTAITAGQRSITSDLNGSTTLLPSTKQHSVVFSAHQNLGPDFSASLDGTFNQRRSADNFAFSTSADAGESGLLRSQSTTSYSIAPRLEWHAPRTWVVALSGVYGWDRAKYVSSDADSGAVYLTIPGRYTDSTKIVELEAEGPLLSLPAGQVRLAFGGGHRSIGLTNYAEEHADDLNEILQDTNNSRSSNFAYGELFVPVIEPRTALTGVRRLELTAALRYEAYGKIGNMATPKLGIVYAPIDDLTISGSWGKSFKTPTLYQQYGGYVTELFSPAQVGVGDAPSGESVLYATGNNPNLKSERATSWTATAKLTPRDIPGLTIEGSYFRVNYRDRIGYVGVQLDGALSNPLYSEFIVQNPSAALVEDVIAGASRPLINASGGDFDPTNVLGYINDLLRNISSEKISGVDLAFAYDRKLGDQRALNVTASASYLQSTQRLLPSSSSTQLSGTLYYPAKWRARGGATFSDHGFAASAFVNYVGPVTDNTQQTFVTIHSMTTADAVLRITSADRSGVTKGLTLTIALSNIFDAMPGKIRVDDPIYPPYDSTNYSAVGRLISVSLSKRW